MTRRRDVHPAAPARRHSGPRRKKNRRRRRNEEEEQEEQRTREQKQQQGLNATAPSGGHRPQAREPAGPLLSQLATGQIGRGAHLRLQEGDVPQARSGGPVAWLALEGHLQVRPHELQVPMVERLVAQHAGLRRGSPRQQLHPLLLWELLLEVGAAVQRQAAVLVHPGPVALLRQAHAEALQYGRGLPASRRLGARGAPHLL
mmetsp:Transcript_28929/g.81118  ORF Transcript_28929/g.81118 Transcript_28929/m.81118 type:complete len:202 (-) Transcript_28929:268-873(-)